jgi:hypothetical protein
MKTFLRWWLLLGVALSVLGAGYFLATEFYLSVLTVKLNWFILGLFGITSLNCGYRSWKLSKSTSKEETKILKNKLVILYWVPNMLQALGMLGTVYGFCIGLGALSTMDATSAASVAKTMSDLSHSLYIALYTTLLGLITSIILRAQVVFLDQDIKDESYK